MPHVGRSWTGHELEDDCPCPQALCGLVDTDNIHPECTEHQIRAAKTIRQYHNGYHCPAENRSVHQPLR